MFISSMWDVKEPTHFSKRVGVVAILCVCLYDPSRSNKVDVDVVASGAFPQLCADQIETSPSPPRANLGHLTTFCAREWGI